MSFTKVLAQYTKHAQKQKRRTPGPILNSRRVRVVDYCEAAIGQINVLGEVETTGEGFVMKTSAELEHVVGFKGGK